MTANHLMQQLNTAAWEISSGLPYKSKALFLRFCTLADKNGIVEGVRLEQLALEMLVEKAPGRKGAGIPTAENIRSAIRTIEKFKYDHFKVVTQDKKLRIYLPFIQEIYKNSCVLKKESAVNAVEHHVQVAYIKPDLTSSLEPQQRLQDLPEQSGVNATPININNTTNTTAFFSEKTLVPEDFVPNATTIAKALALGFDNVTDFIEIQKFIAWNQSKHSECYDWQATFMLWLMKSKEFSQQKNAYKKPGVMTHVYSKQRPRSAIERVKAAYSGEYDFDEPTDDDITSHHCGKTHCNVVDLDDFRLRE